MAEKTFSDIDATRDPVVAPSAVAVDGLPRPAARASVVPSTAARPRTLLLVEDEPLIAMAEKLALERCGYTVRTARDGEHAVAAIATMPDIALVLMDIDLGPGIDGTVAARRILAEHDVPILFLSGHTDPETIAKTEHITSYGYVVKNSSITVINTSIQMAFRLFDAHSQIRAAEQFRDTIINSISDVIVIFDEQMVSRYKSPNIAPLFGWLPADLVGKPAWEPIHPDDIGVLEQQFRSIEHRSGSRFQMRCRYRRKDGLYRWVDLSVVNLVTDPVIHGYLGNYRDVSDEQQYADDYRLLFEQTLEGLALHEMIFDGEGRPVNYRFVAVNPAFETITGLHAADILGRTVLDVFPNTEPDWIAKYAEVVKTGTPMHFSLYSAAIGKHFEVTAFRPVYPRFVSVFRDITGQKVYEQQLSDQTRLLQSILDTSADGFWIVDTAGTIIDVNESYCALTGYTVTDLVGQQIGAFDVEETASTTRQRMAEIAAGKAMVFETRHRCRDGSVKDLEVRASYLNLDGGRFVSFFTDVTEQKRSDAHIHRLMDEKELLLKELQHRVKNTMQSMASLLSLRATATNNAEVAATLRDAQNRFGSIQVLYDQLYRTETHDRGYVGQYLQGLIEMMVDAAPAHPRVGVTTQIDDFVLEVRELTTVGLIVNEVVTNALKYAFAGRASGTVALQIGTQNDPSGRVGTIVVADDGCGFAAALPTATPGAAAATAALGTAGGFGLTLITALTEQLRGHFRFEQHAGTRFVLVVPINGTAGELPVD